MAPCIADSFKAFAPSRAQLRFVPRSSGRRPLAFPCNAAGHVDIDLLSDIDRNDYFFARALMGRDYAFPVVTTVDG
jgi:hypothetical protein